MTGTHSNHIFSKIQSVVICHPSEQEALVRQEEFWKCVCSMEHTIASKVVLRGGGQTELHCAEVLLQGTLKSTGTFISNSFSVMIFLYEIKSFAALKIQHFNL